MGTTQCPDRLNDGFLPNQSAAGTDTLRARLSEHLLPGLF